MLNKYNRLLPIVLQFIIYVFTFVLFKLFCHFQIKNVSNVTGLDVGLIFAANHTSEWDGVLIRVALPLFSMKFSPMYYVSRSKNFYNDSGWRQSIYGGLLFKILGAYPAFAGKKDYAHSLQHFSRLLKLKRNVCIFPEGIRSRTGTVGNPHGGVAYLSLSTNSIVVPVTITGIYGLTFKKLICRKLFVTVNFGKPIKPLEILEYSKNQEDFYKVGSGYVLNKIKKEL